MDDNLPPNAALVMLVKREDGGFDVIDKDRNRAMVGTPDQLWAKVHELVDPTTALAVSPPPTMRYATLRRPKNEQTVTQDALSSEISEGDVADAFRTVGEYVRDVAADEYGAPVVNAATTLLSAAASKTTKAAKRLSRGSKPRAKYRRRGK